MANEIRVPTLGESVSEATVGQWLKKAGEAVNADEPVVELETDKVSVEVPAPSSGVMGEITVNEGETVEVGALLGVISSDGSVAAKPAAAKPAAAAEAAPAATSEGGRGKVSLARVPPSFFMRATRKACSLVQCAPATAQQDNDG